MWKNRLIAAVAILIVNLMVSIDQKASLVLGAPVARAMGTSDRGGGGNVPRYPVPSDKDLLEIVGELKYIVPPILYAMESNSALSIEKLSTEFKYLNPYPHPKKAARDMDTVLKKMYRGHQAIYWELKRVTFDAKSDGPCKDFDGHNKDGSAYNTNPKSICLSLPEIKKRIGKHSAFIEITALAIHELSHRVGATEDEAKILQFAITNHVNVSSLENFLYLSSTDNQDTYKTDVDSNILTALKEKDPKALPFICMNLGEISSRLEGVFDKKSSMGANGLFFQKPWALRALKAAVLQSQNLTGFCKDFDPKGVFVPAFIEDQGLDNKKPIPVLNYSEDQNNFLSPTKDDGFLILATPQDWDAAIFNFVELTKNLNQFKSFNKYEN